MNDAFKDFTSQAKSWFERGHEAGFLDGGDLKRLAEVESRTPGDLFVNQEQRPLVVAFFGGTGVGKSSLMNRLVGSPIARTGVERPTSRELTLYVHESIELADLPPELPLDDVRIERHDDDARRSVAWIDAPDIDSTHEHNRECVTAWLPHIDLMVYVVSPERYRDDIGWRVLGERRGRHGWLFVMNRWDEGNAEQRDDFKKMLRGAGFDQPLLLCTCCADRRRGLPSPDEFERIDEAIGELIQEHGVNELARLGHRARLMDLRDALSVSSARCGDDAMWDAVRDEWRECWRNVRSSIVDGLQWPLRVATSRLAAREVGVIGQIAKGAQAVRKVAGGAAKSNPDVSGGRSDGLLDPAEVDYLTRSIWDEWAQSKLTSSFDRLEVAIRRRDLAAGPVRTALDKVGQTARDDVIATVQDQVRATLSNPVGLAGRIGRRVTGFLTAALPTAALGAVAYTLITSYFRAAGGDGEYPGTNFAVSSVLLVGVAWALPFSIDRMLRPSLERTLTRAVGESLEAALDQLGRSLESEIERTSVRARDFHCEATTLIRAISAAVIRPGDRRNEMFARLTSRPEKRRLQAGQSHAAASA